MSRDERPLRPAATGTFEKVAQENPSLLLDLLGFVRRNKKWWLLPILSVFLIVGVLLLLTATAAGPFIYTFF